MKSTLCFVLKINIKSKTMFWFQERLQSQGTMVENSYWMTRKENSSLFSIVLNVYPKGIHLNYYQHSTLLSSSSVSFSCRIFPRPVLKVIRESDRGQSCHPWVRLLCRPQALTVFCFRLLLCSSDPSSLIFSSSKIIRLIIFISLQTHCAGEPLGNHYSNLLHSFWAVDTPQIYPWNECGEYSLSFTIRKSYYIFNRKSIKMNPKN